MKHGSRPPLPHDKDALLAEVELLRMQIYHLQMERDILEEAAEIPRCYESIGLQNKHRFSGMKKSRKMSASPLLYFQIGVDSKNTVCLELKKMLSFVRSGDILFIESISRLARSVKDLLNIVEVLKSKHVALVSLKENFDTATPQGKFMLTIFAAMAELERETTLQRQAEGIAAAKIAGKRFGRPTLTIPDNFSDAVSEWMNGQISAVQA